MNQDLSSRLVLLGKNAIIFAVGNICLRLSSFFLIPLYTHSLSIKEFGLLSVILITIQFMLVVMGLGSRTGMMRFVVEYEENGNLSQLIGTSILINILGGLMVTVTSLIFLQRFFAFILHTEEVLQLLTLCCGSAMSQSLYLHLVSFFRSKNQSLKFVYVNMSATIILLFMTLFFTVVLNSGIIGVLAAQIITYGILSVVTSLGIISRIGFRISFSVFSSLLRFGLPIVLVMSGDLVTDASAIYVLSYSSGLENLASFYLGYKIAQLVLITYILPFYLAYEPFVYSNVNKYGLGLKISRLLTYLCIGFAFVVLLSELLARPLLYLLAPPEYKSAYPFIFVMLPGILFRGVYYVGESLLNIVKRTYITAAIVSFFTLVSLGLNYWLIPIYGSYGAVFVFNFTLISTALTVMVFGLKVYPIPLEVRRLQLSGILVVLYLCLPLFFYSAPAYVLIGVILFSAILGMSILFYVRFFDEKEGLLAIDLLRRMRFRIISE